MHEYIEQLVKTELIWLPEKEIGWYPVINTHYDDEYFNEYIRREHTEIGDCLNRFRVNFVNSYTKSLVLDIGIGCGTFIKKRDNCVGYDICPKATYLLQKKGLFFNPYNNKEDWKRIKGVTFFDSLEHIEWPELILKNITQQFVFISIPIFRDISHIMKSKHFKKNEHYIYFTEHSLIEFMMHYEFKLLEKRDDEIRCGREDIMSYVFRRKSK